MRKGLVRLGLAAAIAAGAISHTPGGIVVYDKGDKKVEIGGQVQAQYLLEDPDSGSSSDRVFFRRLRPNVQGTVSKNWYGKIEVDFGKAEDDNEAAVKDAYLRYTFARNGNFRVTVGNQKPPFSRELLTSSKAQQLVERSFTGDHDYGTPERMLGVRFDGRTENSKVAYSIGVGAEEHDPSATKMDFDSPTLRDSDWNEGVLIAGRVDIHPLGAMKFDQGAFGREETLFTVSVAAFSWSNDDDNNPYTDATTGMSMDPDKADLDSASGVELSGGVRSHGFSADLELQRITGDTVDPMFTGGMYKDGTTDLDKIAFEAGYMVVADRFEIVAGWDTVDADNFSDSWDRTSFGFNYYWNQHKVKLQATYRMNENVLGVIGADEDQLFVQTQFYF